MAEPGFRLRDPEDFPLLYRSANDVSLAAQRRFLNASKVRFGGLLVASVGGVVTASLWDVNLGGAVALVAFVAALAAELYGAIWKPERAWYEGRAAAESVKTLTWRYAVRGESFDGMVEVDVDRQFLGELGEILQDLGDLTLTVESGAGEQITAAMRQARALDFQVRKALYLDGRIRDQQGWYTRKARWNEKRAHRWLLAGITFETVGVIAAAARAFGDMDVDLLGISAAAAATVSAWVQTKQYQNLATAYSVTAQELASVASEVELMTEEAAWSRFVGESEEAISREHTLWRASRGVRVLPPSRGGS